MHEPYKTEPRALCVRAKESPDGDEPWDAERCRRALRRRRRQVSKQVSNEASKRVHASVRECMRAVR